jgi:outer membrane receptor for ferrienterochelin and colicins
VQQNPARCAHRSSVWSALVAPLLVCALATAAWADDAPDSTEGRPDLLSLSLEDLMDVQIDSVYGASRHPQQVTEAPSSVTIITADEIRAYGYRTLADLLRSVRGFYITNDRYYEYAGVRGFGRPGDYNTRMLLIIDGERVNDNVYETAPVGLEGLADIDLIERVEIIRGPSSSLYGTNAFFGVINVITKTAEKMNGLELCASAASFESYRGRVSYAHQWSNDAALVFCGSLYDSQGQDLYFPLFDAPATHDGVAEDCDYESAQRAFASFSHRGLKVSGSLGSREKGIPTGAWNTAFNDPRTYAIDAADYIAVEYTCGIDSRGALTARSSYNHYEYSGDYVLDYSEGNEPDLVINQDSAHGEWLGGEVLLTTQAPGRNRITTGTEFRSNFHIEQTNCDREVYLDDVRRNHLWALYVQDEFTLHDGVILNAGVRHDRYQIFGATTSPRVALICSPAQQTTIKTLYGRAFRAPTAYELYYNDGYLTQKPNPDLQPERIETAELIVEQGFGEHIRGSAAAYEYWIHDLISLELDPADELMGFLNTDRVQARGIELELAGRWAGGLAARVSYALQEAKDSNTDERLSNSPTHLAKANCVVPLLDERFTAGVELQYTSERTAPDGASAGAFGIANITLLRKELLPGFDVSGGIYNIFDEQYADPVSLELPTSTLAQDGRTFRAGVTYRPFR